VTAATVTVPRVALAVIHAAARRASRVLATSPSATSALSAAVDLIAREAAGLVGCWALVIVFLASGLASASPRHESCGEERAAVKLGLDADAPQVAVLPAEVTIAELIALSRPRAAATRRAGAELQVYRVHATIVAYRAEDDGDLHVVIEDDEGRHMIVELPAEPCAAHSAWHEQVVAARRAAEARLHPAAKVRRARIPVIVEGVGFFDKLHRQLGVASNAIELHPVTRIEFADGGAQ
jgi:hypothetical protein